MSLQQKQRLALFQQELYVGQVDLADVCCSSDVVYIYIYIYIYLYIYIYICIYIYMVAKTKLDESVYMVAKVKLDESVYMVAKAKLDESIYMVVKAKLDESVYMVAKAKLDESVYMVAKAKLDESHIHNYDCDVKFWIPRLNLTRWLLRQSLTRVSFIIRIVMSNSGSLD